MSNRLSTQPSPLCSFGREIAGGHSLGMVMGGPLNGRVNLLVSSRYTIAMTGAGVSVESGIPPFRGPGGLWTKHGEPPMDVYQRFLADPKGYWEERLKAPSAIVQALSRSATQRWALRHGRAGANRHPASSHHPEHRQSPSCRRPSEAGGDSWQRSTPALH